MHTSKLLGSSKFQLCFHSLDIQANSTKLAETPDLSNVPSKYYEFTDIFSKTKARVLAPHYSYDFQINLEEGTQPPVCPIYSLSASKKKTLKEFIQVFLNTSFIQPTSSLHGIPVLISNLLDLSYKAQVYTKINLCHAYHLVHIANSDEWKTTFRTCYGLFK